MTVSCFPANESQLQRLVQRLREAGFFANYEEQARGESILVSVHTTSVDEREKVMTIFREVGIADYFYTDQSAA